MCGLGIGLVEAAHIYPVAAPGSTDTLDNGVALCRNHHRSFDRCEIWIRPQTRDVVLHPNLLIRAQTDGAVARFVMGTNEKLATPKEGHGPSDEMLTRRTEWHAELYSWVPSNIR